MSATLELRSTTGGSFIEAQQLENGMCHLSVGLHHTHIIDGVLSVDSLAAILGVAQQVGFKICLQRANARDRSAPQVFIDEDSALAAQRGRT